MENNEENITANTETFKNKLLKELSKINFIKEKYKESFEKIKYSIAVL